jgi:hypothetical protein
VESKYFRIYDDDDDYNDDDNNNNGNNNNNNNNNNGNNVIVTWLRRLSAGFTPWTPEFFFSKPSLVWDLWWTK